MTAVQTFQLLAEQAARHAARVMAALFNNGLTIGQVLDLVAVFASSSASADLARWFSGLPGRLASNGCCHRRRCGRGPDRTRDARPVSRCVMITAQVTAQVGYYAVHRRHASTLVERTMSLRAWLEYVGQFEAADRDHMCALYLAAPETRHARSTTPMAALARREHLQQLDVRSQTRSGRRARVWPPSGARSAGQAAGDVVMRKAFPAAVEVVVASVSILDWARVPPDEVELPRRVKPAPVSDPALAGVAEPVLTATSVYANDDADGW